MLTLFEAFNQNKCTERAAEVFTYLVLSKIMQNSIDDATNLINGRYGTVYADLNENNKLIQEILKACRTKNLVALSNLLLTKKDLIAKDRIISSQIENLYD